MYVLKDKKIADLEKTLGRIVKGNKKILPSFKNRIERLEKTKKPFVYQCGYRSKMKNTGFAVITYDRLTINSLSEDSGGLDIDSGIFTAGHTGVYSVSYSMESKSDNGKPNMVSLFLNDKKLKESEHMSYYRSDMNGRTSFVHSLGSRTLYMKLVAGDKVKMKTGNYHELSHITLCFELANTDLS